MPPCLLETAHVTVVHAVGLKAWCNQQRQCTMQLQPKVEVEKEEEADWKNWWYSDRNLKLKEFGH